MGMDKMVNLARWSIYKIFQEINWRFQEIYYYYTLKLAMEQ